MRVLSHNPFARESIVRRASAGKASCDFCGQPARYEYGTERDDRPGRVEWHKGAFCSKVCHDAYHA